MSAAPTIDWVLPANQKCTRKVCGSACNRTLKLFERQPKRREFSSNGQWVPEYRKDQLAFTDEEKKEIERDPSKLRHCDRFCCGEPHINKKGTGLMAPFRYCAICSAVFGCNGMTVEHGGINDNADGGPKDPRAVLNFNKRNVIHKNMLCRLTIQSIPAKLRAYNADPTVPCQLQPITADELFMRLRDLHIERMWAKRARYEFDLDPGTDYLDHTQVDNPRRGNGWKESARMMRGCRTMDSEHVFGSTLDADDDMCAAFDQECAVFAQPIAATRLPKWKTKIEGLWHKKPKKKRNAAAAKSCLQVRFPTLAALKQHLAFLMRESRAWRPRGRFTAATIRMDGMAAVRADRQKMLPPPPAKLKRKCPGLFTLADPIKVKRVKREKLGESSPSFDLTRSPLRRLGGRSQEKSELWMYDESLCGTPAAGSDAYDLFAMDLECNEPKKGQFGDVKVEDGHSDDFDISLEFAVAGELAKHAIKLHHFSTVPLSALEGTFGDDFQI